MRFAFFNVAHRCHVGRVAYRINLFQTIHPFCSYSSQLNQRQLLLDQDSFIPRIEPNPNAKNIAILGGGITGLTTAFDLSRTIPDAKITIYEKENKLGGWLDSEILEAEGGEVLFEWGPRTLRTDIFGAGKATIDLICNLNLSKDVIGIVKSLPAALNRFIYFPDHLTRMPAPYPGGSMMTNLFRNFSALFREPIFSGMLKSVIAEPAVQTRALDLDDESVGSFLTRRFGPVVADNLASALVHGIYAGDIYKLSMRSLFPLIWYLETRDPDGSGIMAEMLELYFRGQSLGKYDIVRFLNMTAKANDSEMSVEVKARAASLTKNLSLCSVYSFVRGLATLTNSLEDALQKNSNITIKSNLQIESIEYDSTSKKLIMSNTSDESCPSFDYIVSSLRPRMLETFMVGSSRSRGSTIDKDISTAIQWTDHSVNVMVVNLYYNNPNLIPESLRGFGYLIPRSVAIDQNPERALGVIFGSESSGERGSKAILPYTQLPYAADDSEFKEIFEQKGSSKQEMNEKLKQFLSKHSKALEEGRRLIEQNDYDMRNFHSKTSESKVGQDEAEIKEPQLRTLRVGQDTAPGTKLTVMLGGHWWEDWAEKDLPNEDEAIDMAKSLLARHLKIMEQPSVAKAKLQRDAIPQYRVGRRRAMSKIHQALLDHFEGRLKVAGPWWQTGVGVNDCVKKARETAFSIREQWDTHTGLEDYAEPEKWCLVDRKTRRLTIDPMSG